MGALDAPSCARGAELAGDDVGLGAQGQAARSPVAPAPLPAVPDLSKPRLFPRALAALDTHSARIAQRDRIGIVDFAQASREPRFHLVDMASGAVETHLVAHGKGSDPDRSGWVSRPCCSSS